MKKLKTIIRSGVLETNSSSSHSVCISRGEIGNNPKVWDLDLREDGTLFIPSPEMEFGTNDFKSNECLMKIQYAYGLALSQCPEKQYLLTELIKRVTGAREVVFEWVEEYKKEVEKRGGILRGIYVNCPSIDHESVYLFSEVFESEATLKNFIFNPKSWLYGGGDYFDEDSEREFKKECFNYGDEDLDARVTIHFGGETGDMNFEVSQVATDHDCLKCILGDIRTDGMYLGEGGKLYYNKDLFNISNYKEAKKVYTNPEIICERDGKYYFVLYPLSEEVHARRKRLPKALTLEEIKAEFNGVNLLICPITITSETFGELC